MATHEFSVKEVNRDGYIAWEAKDDHSGKSFPLNVDGYLVAGTFPEITAYLKTKGIDATVTYDESHADRLSGGTWFYKRGEHQIVVNDIPRTVLRIRWEPSPYMPE